MDFEHAVAVKDRHEKELLMGDSVEGIGVGEDSGHPVILVYVTGHHGASESASIPDSLEGVPVVIEETGGGFRAF